ncbi:hypothetical protein BKA81DRAFT_63699 [Phyllosticta paracitricarpa]
MRRFRLHENNFQSSIPYKDFVDFQYFGMLSLKRIGALPPDVCLVSTEHARQQTSLKGTERPEQAPKLGKGESSHAAALYSVTECLSLRVHVRAWADVCSCTTLRVVTTSATMSGIEFLPLVDDIACITSKWPSALDWPNLLYRIFNQFLQPQNHLTGSYR